MPAHIVIVHDDTDFLDMIEVALGGAGDQVRIGGASGRRQQHGGSGDNPHCNFARNVSWHALQMLRSLNAASTLALSPPRSATSSTAT